MVRYLLGSLSEQDMARVEEKFFADDESFDQLMAVENDLIDRFVRGRMSEKQKRRFELCYMASPPRRARVDLARALLEKQSSSRVLGRAHWALPVIGLGVKPAYPLAFAGVALILIAGVVWLAVERSRLQNQVAALESGYQKQMQRLGQDLESERQERAQLERQSSEFFVSFVLMPGVTRGVETSRRFVIPPQAWRVRLQLDLAPGQAYASYRAAIRTPTSDEIWSMDMLKAQPAGVGSALFLEIPAALFSGDEYIIALQGATGAGKVENLPSYQFSVLRN